MPTGIDLGMGLENSSIRADHVSYSLGIARSGTLAGAIGKTDLALAIAQQRVREIKF